MKINKLAVATLVAASLSATAVSAEDQWVKVYGKVAVTLDKVDEDNGDDQWEVNSNASRFGIKGKGAAGSLEAFYKLEWQVDVSDSSKTSQDHIKSRNQIIGVRGGFGEVFMGRHDTPTKKLQKKVDIFGDLQGDIKHSFNAEKRASNIMQYTTPKMGGFKAKLAFVPGESTPNNDGLADGTSIALEYKTGGFNFGVSMDSDIEKEGVDTTRAVMQYNTKAWQFGLLFQDTEYDNGTVKKDGTGAMASVKYKAGDNAFKLQVIDSDVWEAGVSSKVKYTSQFSLGWDRKLGKKTTFLTYLTKGEEGETRDDDTTFGIGLVQKF